MRLAMPLAVSIETAKVEPRLYLPLDAVKTDDVIVGKVQVTAIVNDGGVVEMTVEGELTGTITSRPPTIPEKDLADAMALVRRWPAEFAPPDGEALEVARLLHLWAHPRAEMEGPERGA